MKVSIWQQFSSNHSGHFEILGIFEDAESALIAAEALKAILKRIEDWHNKNPEKSEALYPITTPSEIEEILAKEYKLKWLEKIDWFNAYTISIIANHIVYVKTLWNESGGPFPFDKIIERLGGYGLVTGFNIYGEYYGEIWVELRCIAPDIDTAIKIEKSKSDDYEDDKLIESVRRYDSQLVLGWDWGEGTWDLVKLINELSELGCTDISYQFKGRTYTETPRYPFQTTYKDDENQS